MFRTIKAISVKQPWAHLIWLGIKGIETRTWATKHRGETLIVSSLKPDKAAMEKFGIPEEDMQFGKAICTVNLVNCRDMVKEDEVSACCEIYPVAKSWVFDDVKKVLPFPVKGRLAVYEVETEKIIYDSAIARILATGSNSDIHNFHMESFLFSNIIQRQEQTFFYTIPVENLPDIIEAAKKTGVTVQLIGIENKKEKYRVLHQGKLPGWKSK